MTIVRARPALAAGAAALVLATAFAAFSFFGESGAGAPSTSSGSSADNGLFGWATSTSSTGAAGSAGLAGSSLAPDGSGVGFAPGSTGGAGPLTTVSPTTIATALTTPPAAGRATATPLPATPLPATPRPATPTPAATPAPGGPCYVFPSSNVWNQPVSGLSVASNSAAMIDAIGLTAYLHPDFDAIGDGIPFNIVTSTTPTYNVSFDYADESDPGPYPIPSSPRIEAERPD